MQKNVVVRATWRRPIIDQLSKQRTRKQAPLFSCLVSKIKLNQKSYNDTINPTIVKPFISFVEI